VIEPSRTGVVVLLAALLAGCEASGPRFPPADRPVAEIVSPEYGDETARDDKGEALRVMDRLAVRPGLRVADVGAGLGYYTVRLARRLGAGATIYAQDIVPDYLDRLRARLEREGIGGIRVVLGTAGDPKLPPGAVDLAILAHMYHEVEKPYEFLYRLAGALAPGARVAIVDVDKAPRDHGIPPARLRCELAAVGYRQVDFTWLAPADGYLAVFVPPETLPPIETLRPCRE
jgi:SAM-dependent methyltransferase